jgi:pentatricopeptide repeat protein
MYGKCGSIWEASKIFRMLPQHRTDSWNEMLSACNFHGEQNKTLEMFEDMQNAGVPLDETTLVCALQACSEMGSIDICRHVHSIIASCRVEMDLRLATTLVHAYGSCASMLDAQEVFNNMPEHDVVSWTALIAGYAREGNSTASRNWYNKMRRACVVPNKVTFLSLLCACSHAGLIDEGIEYFESMKRDYGMAPEADHIMYLVDLIARGGDLSKVEAIIARLSIQSSATTIWLSLLGACQRHGNVSLGKKAFERVLELQPNEDLAYVLMSNIYVDATVGEKGREACHKSKRRLQYVEVP